VLTVEKSAEDLGFIACQRIERFCKPFWSDLLAGGDEIQGPDRVGWIIDLGEGGQIPTVGR